MKTVQDLPELVIVGILKYAVKMVIEFEDLVPNLPYLAICRQWRNLALPIVHKNLLIKFDSMENEDGEVVYKLLTNISLLANDYCNSLVKRLQIEWEKYSLMDNLHILMNTIAMGNQTWPEDVSGHLVDDTQNHSEDYDSQKLDIEMYDEMSGIIDNFRDTFPNIKEIVIDMDDSCGVSSQFFTKLVDIYFNQLTMLTNLTCAPLDLPCFPPNLTYLYYSLEPMSFKPMPKINSLPLKVLRLREIPKEFSLNQCCSSPVFPNLKFLSIYGLSGNYQGERETLAHRLGIKLDIPDSQEEQLEFPAIKTLKTYFLPALTSRFNIKKISKHLDNLSFLGNLEELEKISKLSSNSIGCINISLDEAINDTNKLRKAANKLLNNIKNNHDTILQPSSDGFIIDYQKINLKGVTLFNIPNINNTLLVNAIAAMPLLLELSINFFTYTDEEVDWSLVANSKIETLYIRNSELEGQVEKLANFIVQLFGSLKHLEDAEVHKTLRDVLNPKLEEAKKDHQHLKELDIEWVEPFVN